MFLAIRDIRFAKGRFALMGAVVALITLLLVMLSGLTAGLGEQSTSAIDKLGAVTGGGGASTPVDSIVFGAPGTNEPKASFTESEVTAAQLESLEEPRRRRNRRSPGHQPDPVPGRGRGHRGGHRNHQRRRLRRRTGRPAGTDSASPRTPW